MDCLLLLCNPKSTTGYDGHGDFILGTSGEILKRRQKSDDASPAYMGAYIVHPRLFADAPQGAFSMNRLWDKAMATRRLFGLVHDGHWLHVGTMAAIADAEAVLNRQP